LRELVQAAPGHRHFAVGLAEAWWQLGYAHARAGSEGEARADWARGLEVAEALAREGNEPFLRDLRARLLLALDRADEAQPVLDQLKRLGYREPVLVAFCQEHGVLPEPGSTERP
jgi:hypothetical protein